MLLDAPVIAITLKAIIFAINIFYGLIAILKDHKFNNLEKIIIIKNCVEGNAGKVSSKRKLKFKQVEEIRFKYINGLTGKAELSKESKVDNSVIREVLNY